jgi:hypothetical protein
MNKRASFFQKRYRKWTTYMLYVYTLFFYRELCCFCWRKPFIRRILLDFSGSAYGSFLLVLVLDFRPPPLTQHISLSFFPSWMLFLTRSIMTMVVVISWSCFLFFFVIFFLWQLEINNWKCRLGGFPSPLFHLRFL